MYCYLENAHLVKRTWRVRYRSPIGIRPFSRHRHSVWRLTPNSSDTSELVKYCSPLISTGMLRFCSLCYFSSRHVRKGKRCCTMLHVVASVTGPVSKYKVAIYRGRYERQSQGPPASHVDTEPLPDAAINSGTAKRRTSTTSCSRSFVCSVNRLRRIKARHWRDLAGSV